MSKDALTMRVRSTEQGRQGALPLAPVLARPIETYDFIGFGTAR